MEEKKVRHRTALSCSECRRLNLKCTRSFPCTNCVRRGCGHICPNGTMAPSNRVSKASLHLALLLQRVKDLESILSTNGLEALIPAALDIVLNSPTTNTSQSSSDSSDNMASGSSNNVASGSGTHRGERMDGIREEDNSERDLLEAVGSLTIKDEDGSTRYLGLSSGSAYFANTDSSYSSDEDTDFKSPSPTSPPAITPIVTTYPFTKSGSTYPVSLGASKALEIAHIRSYLPPKEEGRRLATNYWLYVSFMFEPLQEDVFWDDYFVSAYTLAEDHGTKLACVYIILALGSLFDRDAPATFNASANQYFLLSQTSLSAARFLSENTQAAAQTIHLTGNFLFNTHKLKDGGETFFCLFSLALRMVPTMGLHHDGSKWDIKEPELERKRLLFYELMTLDRLQSFLCGRPYVLQDYSFDTKMPTQVDDYQITKFKVGKFLGKVIDDAFSIKTPTYATILALDQELRDLFGASPTSVRSGVLPENAFVVRPPGPCQFPIPATTTNTLKLQMRQHTLDMLFAQIAHYLHKPHFAQALIQYPDEPLRAPWASSVACVILESGTYILALAKNWITLDPILCPRWWHIFFHAYAAATSHSTLIVKSPQSMLAQFAWQQLNEAVTIFETASIDGAPVILLLPRVKVLRDNAFNTLQANITIPQHLPDIKNASPTSEHSPTSVHGDSITVLGASTHLVRKPRKVSRVGEIAGISGLASQFTPPSPVVTSSSARNTASSYTPYDFPYPLAPTTFGREFPSYHYTSSDTTATATVVGGGGGVVVAAGESSITGSGIHHDSQLFNPQELINRGLAAQALLQQHQQRIPLPPLNFNLPQNSFRLPPLSTVAQSPSQQVQNLPQLDSLQHQHQHQNNNQHHVPHLTQQQHHQQQPHLQSINVSSNMPLYPPFPPWNESFPSSSFLPPVQSQSQSQHHAVGVGAGSLLPNVQSGIGGVGDEDWRMWSEVMQNSGLNTSPPTFP